MHGPDPCVVRHRVGAQKVASDFLLARHVVSGPRSVAPLLDLKRDRNSLPATCGFRDTEGGPRAAISRVRCRGVRPAPSEYGATPYDTPRLSATAYWMRTGR